VVAEPFAEAAVIRSVECECHPFAEYLFPGVFDLYRLILSTKFALIIFGSVEPAHLCRDELDLLLLLTALTELSASFPS